MGEVVTYTFVFLFLIMIVWGEDILAFFMARRVIAANRQQLELKQQNRTTNLQLAIDRHKALSSELVALDAQVTGDKAQKLIDEAFVLLLTARTQLDNSSTKAANSTMTQIDQHMLQARRQSDK
jgi:hypothetical protein